MIGQQHQVLVKTDDPNAIAPVWRTKLGSSRAIVLGVYVDGELATVDMEPSAPFLRVRRPEDDPVDGEWIPLVAVEDDEEHNLAVEWTDEWLTDIGGAGRYIADVVCTVDGSQIVAPDSGYIVIEVLPGAGV